MEDYIIVQTSIALAVLQETYLLKNTKSPWPRIVLLCLNHKK